MATEKRLGIVAVLFAAVILGGAAVLVGNPSEPSPASTPAVEPTPDVVPVPVPVRPRKPCNPRRPWGPRAALVSATDCGCTPGPCQGSPGVDCGCHGAACGCADCRCLLAGAAVGGRDETIQADLPGDLHQHNINAGGLGCCVFRSADHAARWQGVPAFVHFPEWMVEHGVRGGGWPEKFEELARAIAADRGLPVPEFIQVQGNVKEALIAALESGRMVSGTYRHSPTGRYDGAYIGHVVNYVKASRTEAPDAVWVLDNNYPGADRYEKMSWAEWEEVGCNWIFVLLAPAPAPAPRNK